MDPSQQPQYGGQPTQPPSNPPQAPGNFNANQFDFITNPPQPPKKKLIPGGGKGRLLFLVGGGAIVLMIVIILVSTLLGGSSSGVSKELLTIAQKQNEIIRVSGIGVDKAGTPAAKKLAISTKLTVTTDQQELLAYMKQQKIKYKPKDLSLLANSKTTQELENAELNGRFDEVFTRIITDALEDYQKSMTTAYNTSENRKTKELLAADIANVPLLLEKETDTETAQ